MLYQGLIIFQVLVAASIIALVLLQQGRGADAGAAFGSGASGTVFGARGASSFLTRTTAVLAVLFFSSSLFLATVADSSRSKKGLIDLPGLDEPETAMPSAPPTKDSVGEGGSITDLPADLPGNEPATDIVEPRLQGGEEMPDVPVINSDLPDVPPIDQSSMDGKERQ